MTHISIPDNTLLETSYELSDSEIEVLNFGQFVKISGDYIFARCHQIRELEIPSGTLMSGHGIFYYSNGLQNLKIANNVRLFGNYLFQECKNLESLAIGNSTIISGNNCFSGLSGLQRLQLSPNIIFSGYYLFALCDSIRELIIPDNCMIRGDFFFKKSPRLERIVIGNNVVIQGSQCFFECSGLRSITIGDNVTISGLKFMEGCFSNQNVEITIGQGYVGYPINIPMPILHVMKFIDIKDTLRYEAKKCMISLEKFNDDSDVIVLRCGHVFLVEPLRQWLEIQKICPTCKQSINSN